MERGKLQLREQYGSRWRRWSATGVLACALVTCTTATFGQQPGLAQQALGAGIGGVGLYRALGG